MQQIALDIGLHRGPSLRNFCAGPNLPVLQHLEQWLNSGTGPSGPTARPPVPTYWWGEQGSGKTHLLKAAALGLHQQGAVVGWLDATLQTPPDYNERWAAVLMDDVHLYPAALQHTAFSWFVQAHSLQRPVLASGSLAPADLPLREDLRTRLGWGHIFHLQLPGEPECRAALRQAADERGIVLGDEVMDFMLHRFSRDLGNLMELLALLDGYSLQTRRAVTIPLIKSMLENL